MKHLLPALRLKIFMMLLLGIGYPLLVTGIAKLGFAHLSEGSLVSRNGGIVGSHLIAQKFEKPEYFWPRPSAVDYNPLASGGSNLSQTSEDLKKAAMDRATKLKAQNPDQHGEPPQDLLFASGSGLDPHLSIAATEYQVARVAKARQMPEAHVRQLVAAATQGPDWRLFGESTVNVLALNLSLDAK